jgi:hypothetical protein
MFVVGVTHFFALLQHPLQAAPPHEQAPTEHASPIAQDAHATPPAPHELPLCIA